MKNKKGFTLIELLAVIVILSIILLIAVPLVNGIIEETKKSAFSSSASMIAKTVENEFLKKLLKKYDYYSERKINILIKICEEEILIKKEKKQLLISIVMFILPFFISIIALFQIQERTKLVIFLTISLIILLIILILYYCFKYINTNNLSN
jgi:prepilin-type N-terminal cleavage/methylation domain-containing protein